LAFYQGDATTVEALIQQADVMLYQAKGAGRNNVQVALRLISGHQPTKAAANGVPGLMPTAPTSTVRAAVLEHPLAIRMAPKLELR
jgi:hypothetical protein